MSSDPLPVAVIGAGAAGRCVLEALTASDLAEVVGVSDKDAELAREVGAISSTACYHDNRSLLAETKPAAVFITTPPAGSADLLAACAERGIHVFKELPLARNLNEGVAITHLMEKAKLKLVVGTQRRFAAGYRRAADLRAKLGQVFLARAHYMFNWGDELDWRGDKSSAGGGALLELGYHPLDLLVWMLGLPDEVYGTSRGGHRPEPTGPAGDAQPVYDTDDTAVAMLRYSDGCVGNLVVSRRCGPVSEQFSLHGKVGSVTADSETCIMRDPEGMVLDSITGEDSPASAVTRQVEAFIGAVTSGSKLFECSGRENLLNLAVIEAIYLSSQTGQPESPAALLEQHDITVSDCLELRPGSASPWNFSESTSLPTSP